MGILNFIIIDHAAFLGEGKDSIVDVGSSLDAYAGVKSRDYNQNVSKWCLESPQWMAPSVCAEEEEPGAIYTWRDRELYPCPSLYVQ